MSKCHKKESSMRLFIASPVILDDYASIKEDFDGIIEGKWVEEENLHLTWVFLGEVDDPGPIMEKLQTIDPLETTVTMAELGYFGRPPRVFFAKAESKLLSTSTVSNRISHSAASRGSTTTEPTKRCSKHTKRKASVPCCRRYISIKAV